MSELIAICSAEAFGPVRQLLQKLGLLCYEDTFRGAGLDRMEVLYDLTDQELQDLKIGKLFHRKRLLDGIAAHKASAAANPIGQTATAAATAAVATVTTAAAVSGLRTT